METTNLILIPAYNEEKNIKKVLESMCELQLDAHILVVNDGSSDLTEQIAESFPVYVITHPTNLGYAATLQTGFHFAKLNGYEVVIQFDADGQHDPHYIKIMLEEIIHPEIDIIIGSRFLMGSQIKSSLAKKFAWWLFRGLILILTRKKITDPTSGFRAYKREVFVNFTKPNFFPSEYPDTNFVIELLLHQYKLTEIPVNMKNREHGESMHSGLKPILYIFQILLSISIVWIRHMFTKKVITK